MAMSLNDLVEAVNAKAAEIKERTKPKHKGRTMAQRGRQGQSRSK